MSFSAYCWKALRAPAAFASGTQTETCTKPSAFFLSRYASARAFAFLCAFIARAARASRCASDKLDRSSFIAFISHSLLRYSSRSNGACITQVKRDKNVGFAFVDSLHNFNIGAPHPLLKLFLSPSGGPAGGLAGSVCIRITLTCHHKLRLWSLLPGKEIS